MTEDKKVEPATDEEVQALNDKFNEEQERAKQDYVGGSDTDQTAANQQRDEAVRAAREAGISDQRIAEAAAKTIERGGNFTHFIAELGRVGDLTTDLASNRADMTLLDAYADGKEVDMGKVREAMKRQGMEAPRGWK